MIKSDPWTRDDMAGVSRLLRVGIQRGADLPRTSVFGNEWGAEQTRINGQRGRRRKDKQETILGRVRAETRIIGSRGVVYMYDMNRR